MPKHIPTKTLAESNIEVIEYELEKSGYRRQPRAGGLRLWARANGYATVCTNDQGGHDGARQIMVSAWDNGVQIWTAKFSQTTPPFVVMTAVITAAER